MSALPAHPAPPTRYNPWAIWGIAASFYFVAIFHRMALGIAGISAETQLGVSADEIAAFTAVQMASYLLMQLPAGIASDRIGPRKTLAVGLLLIGGGETIFAFAESLGPALIGRAFVGCGDALVFLNVMRLAYRWFPANRWPILATLTGAIGSFGNVLGTVPLQQSLDHLGWTPTFLIAAGGTVLLAAVSLRFIVDRPASSDPAPETHPQVLKTVKAALKTPQVRHGLWTHTALFGPFQVFAGLWGVPFLVDAQGLSHAEASRYLLALVATFAIAGPLVGLIAARGPWVRDRLIFSTGLVQMLCWVSVLFWPGGKAPHALILAAFIAVGITAAGGMVSFAIAGRAATPETVGTVSSLINFGGFGFAAIMVASAGLLIGSGPSDISSYQRALAPTLIGGAIALVMMARYALVDRAQSAPSGNWLLRLATR